MLRFDQLEIVHPDGRIQFYDLDPASGILNIGRHADNDVVLQGPDVRAFHALLDYRQSPYQVLLLDDQRAGTTAQEFTLWQNVRIGQFELVLIEQPRRSAIDSGSRSTARSTARPQDVQQPSSFEFQTSPAQDGKAEWHIQPGRALTHSLTIHNSGGREATFHIDIRGIDPDWVHLSQREVKLSSDAHADIQVTIAPPRLAQTQIGIYPFTWHIQSPDYPDWQQTETVTVAVEPFRHVEWGQLTPAAVQSSMFRPSGSSRLAITNTSNQALDYVLWGKDLRDECHLQFKAGGAKSRAQAGQDQESLLVHIAPGETIPVVITLTPIEGRLIGAQARRSRFVVYGGYPGEKQADHSVTGTFEGFPVINAGLLLVVVLLLAITALFFYRERFSAWVDNLLRAPVVTQPAVAHAEPAQQPVSSGLPQLHLSTQAGRGGGVAEPPAMTLEEIFKVVGRRYNVDWRLLASLAYRESLLDPKALGGSGEVGLMQIMPATWQEWAPLVDVENPWDPYSNVTVGAAYLAYLHGYFSEMGYTEPRWALAAYNWGPERVLQIIDRRGRWQEIPLPQRQYVADILMGVERAPAWISQTDPLIK